MLAGYLGRNLARMRDIEIAKRHQAHEIAPRVVVHEYVNDSHVLKRADEINYIGVLYDLQDGPLVFAVVELEQLENAATHVRNTAKNHHNDVPHLLFRSALRA